MFNQTVHGVHCLHCGSKKMVRGSLVDLCKNLRDYSLSSHNTGVMKAVQGKKVDVAL